MKGYDRTEEGFKKAFNSLEMMLRWHNKPYWLVASNGKYHVSAVKPRLKDIEKGTTANLYNTNLDIIECIPSEE